MVSERQVERELLPPERLLSFRETRDILGISEAFLHRIIREGGLPVVKIGDRILVRPSDLHAFIEERLTRGGHGTGAA